MIMIIIILIIIIIMMITKDYNNPKTIWNYALHL